jgi:hypothetical protein
MSAKARRRPRHWWERWWVAGADRWLYCDGCGRIVFESQEVSRIAYSGPGCGYVFAGHAACVAELGRGLDRLPLVGADGPGSAGLGREDQPAARPRRLDAG